MKKIKTVEKRILKPILEEIWMHIQRSEVYQRVK